MSQFGRDLTVGNIGRTLASLAVPIFLNYALLSSYTIVNSLWIGNLLGEYGLAAVAVNFPISMFLLVFFNSMGTSVSILISHSFGAKNNAAIQTITNTAFPLVFVLAGVICAAGVASSDLIVRAFNTPTEVRAMTSGYLKLTFVSYVVFALCSLTLSIFRSVGNVKLPLLITFLGVMINGILDPLLIAGVGPFPKLGLNGAAFATIACNVVILLAGFLYLRTKYSSSPISPKKFAFDRPIIGNIMKLALPSFLQQTLMYVGTGLMTVFVNGFGIKAAAAYGTVGRIDAFALIPAAAVLYAVMTVTAQHIGSNKATRVKDIFRWGLVVNTPVIACIALLVIAIPETVMRAFVRDPEIVTLGAHYFRLAGIGYLFYIPNFVANGVVTAAKKPHVSLAISIFMILFIRVPLAALLIYSLGLSALTAVAAATTLSLVVGTGMLVVYVTSWTRRHSLPHRGPSEAAVSSPQ